MANNGGAAVWSKTANLNATIDSTVGFSEGQAPSSLNDGCRAMMASAAKWRDDISGATLTTGISTAYIVSSNQNFLQLSDLAHQVIGFTPHTTNGPGPVTLNVDNLALVPLRTAPNQELQAGTLIAGTPYLCVLNPTDNAFYLQSFFGNPYNVPLGASLEYWGATAPNSSFVFPIGQQISITAYASLYTLFGPNRFGTDTSSLFFLPDCRGRVVAQLDPTGAILTSATMTPDGNTLGAKGGTQQSSLGTSNMASYTPSGSVSTGVSSSLQSVPLIVFSNGGTNTPGGGANQAINGGIAATFSASSSFSGNNNGGTSAPFSNVMPAILANRILRVL